MAEDVKRVHYFDHQFLHEKDFTDEQDYHIRLRREHNRGLHTWGVVRGLGLYNFNERVHIEAGMAIDSLGQEIVLAETANVDFPPVSHPVLYFITISYHEEETDSTIETGVTGNTRWTERPIIEVSVDPPTDPDLKLILGVVEVEDGWPTEPYSGIGENSRRIAGVVGGNMEAYSLTLRNPSRPPHDWPRFRSRENTPLQVDLTGNLNVSGTITATLGSDIVGNTQLATDAVTSEKIKDNEVTESKLATDAVTTRKIKDYEVTESKLAMSAVTSTKIKYGAVRFSTIQKTLAWNTTLSLRPNETTSYPTGTRPLNDGNPVGTVLVQAFTTTELGEFEWKVTSQTTSEQTRHLVYFHNLVGHTIEVNMKIYLLWDRADEVLPA